MFVVSCILILSEMWRHLLLHTDTVYDYLKCPLMNIPLQNTRQEIIKRCVRL